MKPLLLGVGLFFAFLLVRNTLTVSAQHFQPEPPTARDSSPESRARRIATLEAQEQTLGLRQHEIEQALDRIAEFLRKAEARVAREIADAEPSQVESTLRDHSTDSLQLVQKKKELQHELERVVAERQRLQEDWQSLTGLRHPAR